MISQFSYINSDLFDLAAAQGSIRGTDRHRLVVQFETKQRRFGRCIPFGADAVGQLYFLKFIVAGIITWRNINGHMLKE